MHNRARLIVAHFLCKTLYIDWREGAQHFVDLLVDGDVASNTMNWQWVAGTGTDSRFNRTYNVVLQARRHDPRGAYVRRYVEELAGLDDALRARAVAAARGRAGEARATRRRSSTRTRRRDRACAQVRGSALTLTPVGSARVCSGLSLGGCAAMLRAMPPKTMPWNGATAHQ